MHDSLKIVLQRQFFEALVRATFVKFASGDCAPDLNTLSSRLDFLFKNNFQALAVKNKCKTSEDEKAFKVCEKVFEDYCEELESVFSFFAKKNNVVKNGMRDCTLQVNELLEMLRTANFFDGKIADLTIEEVIHLVEKYYDPSTTLANKLSKESFKAYLGANPHLLPQSEH